MLADVPKVVTHDRTCPASTTSIDSPTFLSATAVLLPRPAPKKKKKQMKQKISFCTTAAQEQTYASS
jgi:hypothetical protein